MCDVSGNILLLDLLLLVPVLVLLLLLLSILLHVPVIEFANMTHRTCNVLLIVMATVVERSIFVLCNAMCQAIVMTHRTCNVLLIVMAAVVERSIFVLCNAMSQAIVMTYRTCNMLLIVMATCQAIVMTYRTCNVLSHYPLSCLFPNSFARFCQMPKLVVDSHGNELAVATRCAWCPARHRVASAFAGDRAVHRPRWRSCGGAAVEHAIQVVQCV